MNSRFDPAAAEIDVRRRDHRHALVATLDALGRKDFDAMERWLDPEVRCSWPFKPVEWMPDELVGARTIRQLLETSTRDWAPFAYTVDRIHDLVDPDCLIAEYRSHSEYRPLSRPYSNAYISVFRFSSGRISEWREYLDPALVARTMQP